MMRVDHRGHASDFNDFCVPSYTTGYSVKSSLKSIPVLGIVAGKLIQLHSHDHVNTGIVASKLLHCTKVFLSYYFA